MLLDWLTYLNLVFDWPLCIENSFSQLVCGYKDKHLLAFYIYYFKRISSYKVIFKEILCKVLAAKISKVFLIITFVAFFTRVLELWSNEYFSSVLSYIQDPINLIRFLMNTKIKKTKIHSIYNELKIFCVCFN